jgi:hypothetical protein
MARFTRAAIVEVAPVRHTRRRAWLWPLSSFETPRAASPAEPGPAYGLLESNLAETCITRLPTPAFWNDPYGLLGERQSR